MKTLFERMSEAARQGMAICKECDARVQAVRLAEHMREKHPEIWRGMNKPAPDVAE